MSKEKVILLIEDNMQDELLTLRALRKNNIDGHVIVCRDGAEALDWLFCEETHKDRDPSLRPQVILLDINLPKLDGHEVLKQIRTNDKTRRYPVVVLTTSEEQSDVFKSYDLGANSYVRKPVDYLEFAEAIKHLGSYWLELNETAET